ncbi:MAG TPA: NAD(P)/FAD-dependent oxidoreductase [Anaerolineae bacterium]|nr:NAD(P)/FAD-dependent oxidoreductase [Anaerolineae bacterium]
MTTGKRFTVVIAGAGYAGLAAARTLARDTNVRVILINKHAYHLLQFQLHEAAVSKIDVDTLALPMKYVLPRDVEFVKAQIAGFDFTARSVHTDRGDFNYDRLIIALGSQPATFNIPGLSEHALMLKSVANARSIRDHLEITLSALASATQLTPYPIVVGGAGITGVELATELAEGLRSLEQQYDLKHDAIKIVLVEAAATVLPGFDRKTINEAARMLRKLNVDVRTSTPIERVEADRVWVKPIGSDRSEAIETQSIIWTGGVRANALVLNSGLTLGERGAAVVDEYLRSIDHSEVLLVGDNAVVRDLRDGTVVIPCGQLAAQQGEYAAEQIIADVNGEVATPYMPHLDGLLISLGSYAGVGTVGPVWVRDLLARVMKIGAETRYLFHIGGVSLVLARGLLLRHEFVTMTRWWRGTKQTPHATNAPVHGVPRSANSR